MGRRVAVVGIILLVAGTALSVLSQPPPQIAPSVPMDRAVNLALSLLPMLGVLCMWVGAVMIALTLAMRITGRVVVPDTSSTLLWAGLGAVVLGVVVEVGGFLTFDRAMSTWLMIILLAAAALRIVGATLLAFWLTIVLIAGSTTRRWGPELESSTGARARYADVLDGVTEDREEVVITRAGRERVVIVPLADYESLRETAYLMRSPANARRLLDARERLEAGRRDVRARDETH